MPYKKQIKIWIAFAAMSLFAFTAFPFNRVLAAAPALSTASITDGATGIARDAAITFDFDTALHGPSLLSSTWSDTVQSFGGEPPGGFTGITFPMDANTGWASGPTGKIFKTTDGGANWTLESPGISNESSDIQFISFTIGFNAFKSNKIAKTTNGGTSWTLLENSPLDSNNMDRAVHFLDANTGFTTASGASDVRGIYKTADGGSTWTRVWTDTSDPGGGSNSSATDYSFAGSNGWAVTKFNGTLLSTVNTGDSWSKATISAEELWGVHFVDANTGWAVGDAGTILKTTNGGSSWNAQTSETVQPLYTVFFADSNTGWISGESNTILKTSNGGTTWTAETYSVIDQNYATLDFDASAYFDSTNMWFTGSFGRIIRPQPSVTLQANSPNTQGGTPSGSNLCATVTLGADGSANPDRRVTCNHSNLTSNTWYTATIPVTVTSATGEAIPSQITRTFQTALLTFYVDGTSGTDQVGCGSATGASACRTIQYAVTAASSGDTISVAAGTYNEQVQLGTKNLILDGNNVATLTDTSRPGASAGVLDISEGQTSSTIIRNWTFNVSASTPNNGIKITGASYPIIQNNTINHSGTTLTAHSIYINSSSPSLITVRNNTLIKGGTSEGNIFFDAANLAPVLVDSNIVRGGSFIWVQGSGNVTIVNNIGSGGGGIAITASNTVPTTAIVANNTIDGSGNSLILTDAQANAGTLTAYIKNNILSSFPLAGMAIDQTGNPITLYSNHNLFYRPTPGNFVTVQTGGGTTPYATLDSWIASSGNPDALSVFGNPLFTNAAGNDFTLANNSAAIGRGTKNIVGTNDLATYSANVDFLDNARPYSTTLVDIGAYENQVMGEVTSVAVTGTNSLNIGTPIAQLTATATYNLGPPQNVSSSALWASSDATKAVVSSSGMARGMGSGSSNVTAFVGVTSPPYSVNTAGLPAYVSIYTDAVSGNDITGTGSSGAPYKTIAKCVSEVTGGARIYLKGTFTGEQIGLPSSLSGTAANNTWISNWPGQSATINRNGINPVIDIQGADYVTIQGLNITGSTDSPGIRLRDNSDYILVNNNTFYGNRFGIAGHAQSIPGVFHTFSNNLIYNNLRAGIYISNGQNNASVFNNVIYENNGTAGFEAGILLAGTLNTVGIWNNTIVNHIGGGLNATDLGAGAPTVTNLTVKNNIFAQTAGGSYAAPIKIKNATNVGTGNTFNYNLYYTTNNVPLVTVDVTSYSTLAAWRAASAHDDNSISVDPIFINAPGDIYTILSSSPAVNAGTPSGSVGIPGGASADFAGTLRNSLFDIGAYEILEEGGRHFRFISVNASIKINLGTHRDLAFTRIFNQLLTALRPIPDRISIAERLRGAAGEGVFNDLAAFATNTGLRSLLLDLVQQNAVLRKLLRGQSSNNLLLEVWLPGDRITPLATALVTTNIFGEGLAYFSSLEGVYDITIKKPFGLRQSLPNLSIASFMTLEFPSILRVGDFDRDGLINRNDFLLLIDKVKNSSIDLGNYDLNEDGELDLNDFADFIWSSAR